MYCRNIYCNLLRTLRYWHLNIPTVTIHYLYYKTKKKKKLFSLLHETANWCNTTKLLLTDFFYSLSFFCSILVQFFTNIYTLLSTLIKNIKYANHLLNVDHVTSLANLLFIRNLSNKNTNESNLYKYN